MLCKFTHSIYLSEDQRIYLEKSKNNSPLITVNLVNTGMLMIATTFYGSSELKIWMCELSTFLQIKHKSINWLVLIIHNISDEWE